MPRHASGFTLLEVVFATTLLALLLAAAAPLIGSSLTAQSAVRTNANLLSRAQYAAERIGRELRHMRLVTTPTDAYFDLVAPTSATALCFTRSDSTPVYIGLNGTTIEIQAGANACASSTPKAVLLAGVQAGTGLQFAYLKPDFTAIAIGDATLASSLQNVQFTVTLSGAGQLSQQGRVLLRDQP